MLQKLAALVASAALLHTGTATAQQAVPYTPPPPGTQFVWTDAPDSDEAVYSQTSIVNGPGYTIYLDDETAGPDAEFHIEYYGIYYVTCPGDPVAPEDIQALERLWPLKVGNTQTLTTGTVFTVTEPFMAKVPYGKVSGLIVSEEWSDIGDEERMTDYYSYLPDLAQIAIWEYDYGTDYLLEVNHWFEPGEALQKTALEACGLGAGS